MRQFNKFRGTKGFISLWEQMIRFRYMITEQAKQRCRILAFWERHGNLATKEAFDVSRRTLYRWQNSLTQSGGKLDGLNAKNTAPHHRRKRHIPNGVSERIITLRTAHPRLGKDKLYAILALEGYRGSISTIGRILADIKKAGQLPDPAKFSLSARTGRLIERKPQKRKKKLRRPAGYRVL